MMVNGQPIEMCAKTLMLCNQRCQKLLNNLKKQSLDDAHTFRIFWGDVIMLNILTNQLLQKVPAKTLARIVKPIDSLQDDLQEYRDDRKKKTERLKNALIVANDPLLPLDYSRELEKYYKDDFSNDSNEEDIEGTSVAETTQKSKVSDIQIDETKISQTNLPPKKDTPKKDIPQKTVSQKQNIVTSKQPQNLYRQDDDEEVVDFGFISPTPPPQHKAKEDKKENTNPKTPTIPQEKTNNAPIISSPQEEAPIVPESNEEQFIPQEEKPIPPPAPNEFQKNIEAFTQYESMDFDSLFS